MTDSSTLVLDIKPGQTYFYTPDPEFVVTIIFADQRSVVYEKPNKYRRIADVNIFLEYYKLKKEKVKAQTKFIPVGIWPRDDSKTPVIMSWSWYTTRDKALNSDQANYKVIDVIEVNWEGEVP